MEGLLSCISVVGSRPPQQTQWASQGLGGVVARGDGGCTTPGEGELPARARASEIEV